MARTLPIVLAFVVPASVAHAQTIFTNKWDGAIRIVKQTSDCTKQFVSADNNRAFYHLRLDQSYPFSSLTRFAEGETELILGWNVGTDARRSAAKVHSRQFAGSGQYQSYKIAHGFISGTYYGTYTFTQNPTVVTAATPFIDLTGTLDNYNNTTGCTITLRGTFVRVGPEDEAPPPY
jgi:hypothetical protein